MRVAREATVQYEVFNHLEIVPLSPVSGLLEMPQPKRSLTTLQKVGYVLLVTAMLFIAFQAIRCLVASSIKLEGLMTKIAVVKDANQKANHRKTILQDKISLYSSHAGVEEMARERLGLVEKDEILIRLYPSSVAQR